MDFFRTLLHYASNAWNFVTGIPGDIGKALDAYWRYTGAVYSLFAHIYSRIGKDIFSGYLTLFDRVTDALEGMNDTTNRVKAWIFANYIKPLTAFLLQLIFAVKAQLLARIETVRLMAIHLFFLSLQFTVKEVAIETNARIADVRAARQYAARLVKALHDQLESEAADAYNAHTKDRVSTVTKLVDEIANRNPAVRGLVREFVTVLIDLLGTENPVLRFVLNQVVSRIVSGLGIDKGLGDLLQSLLGPLAGTPKAHSLGDAIGDLAQRAGALEDQWSQFMINGGSELEQAGEEYKELTSFTTSAALLAFFGAAVADPAGWALAVADTVGAVVNDSAAAVAHLIERA